MKRFLTVAIAVLATWSSAASESARSSLGVSSESARSSDKAVVHVLNRIAFGPRAGDVERVRALGVDRYIDQQLHPERLADPAIGARLSGLSSIGLSSREIAQTYELPQLMARRERKEDAKAGQTDQPKPPDPLQQKANSVVVELSEQKVLRAIYSERQLQEVLTDFWFNHFNVDARKGRDRFLLTEYERETIRPRALGTTQRNYGRGSCCSGC